MTGTTNLNLTKPTVGADSDQWGNELNADLDTLDSHLTGVLNGLTLSAAGSTATFGVAAGAASGMVLSSAYTKTTSAWGVGTGQGALDTGAIANSTWYHVYLIQRTDTGVVDILVSTSASSPTMPTNYTRKRRIGAMKTNGSAQWVKFSQYGDEFLWDIPVEDATSATGSTTAANLTLTVPTGVQVNALVSVLLSDSSAAAALYMSSPDVSDQAAAGSGAITLYSDNTTSRPAPVAAPINVRTNTSAQARIRFASNTTSYWVSTKGWIDTRGKN